MSKESVNTQGVIVPPVLRGPFPDGLMPIDLDILLKQCGLRGLTSETKNYITIPPDMKGTRYPSLSRKS